MDATKDGGGSTRLYLGISAIVLVALALRLSFINIVSADAKYFLLPWFEDLSVRGIGALSGGLVDGFGKNTANYSPPYYYLLLIATKFSGVFSALWLIKFVSFSFNFVGAYFAYKISRLNLPRPRALLAAALVFAAPTAIFNDSWFGQCDMIWTSLVLGCVYFALRRRFLLSIAFFGVALSFKAQAVFIAPFLFMLFLRGEFRLRAFAVAPMAYAAMLLPAIAAGVPWATAATTYLRQGEAYDRLSMHAPNLYYFLGESFYQPGVMFGLVLTTVACFVLAVLPRFRKVPLDFNAKLLAATMFVALAPFLLPKMHDRYFFAADVMTIILAVHVPRLWPVAVISQISSLGAYVAMLSQSLLERMLTITLPMAALVNTVLVAYLVYEFWRLCLRPRATMGDNTTKLLIGASAIFAANAIWGLASAAQRVIAARLCSSAPDSVICSHTLPFDWAINGDWGDWIAFSLILVGCLFRARTEISRLWVRGWPDWSTRLAAWFHADARQPQ